MRGGEDVNNRLYTIRFSAIGFYSRMHIEDKNKDQILILTDNETRALVDLFKLLIQKDLLPF